VSGEYRCKDQEGSFHEDGLGYIKMDLGGLRCIKID
jgi:hypothetical protein